MFKRFFGDKRGNFAIMFAFATMPILGGVAMTLEYTNLSRNFAALQNATDAAALFAGRYYVNNSRTLPSNANFKSFVEANFEGQLDSATLAISGDDLVVSVKSTAPAFFFGNLAPSAFVQTAGATIPVNNAVDIEVALVLDVTGSMSEQVGGGDSTSKIDRLKAAAKKFIDTLDIEGPGNDNSVKFSIVPFAAHVNVGSEYRWETWINVPAAPVYGEVCNSVNQPYSTDKWGWRSISNRWGGYWGWSYQTVWHDNWVQQCSTQYQGEKSWKGCVGSRSGNYAFTDADYNSRKIEALMNSADDNNCPTEKITPLTNNVANVKSKIDSLTASGGTYIAPGVMWGQRLLSPQVPFDQGKALGAVAHGIIQQKAMIVMTDGQNTFYRGNTNTPYHDGGNGYSWNSEGDAETRKACQTVRDSGTVIYSIAFGAGVNSTTKTLLVDCAGSAARFFNATDAQKLNEAFSNIAGRIMKLHLTS